MSGILNSNKDGMGNVIPEFPLKPGMVDTTSGAISIDVTSASIILILTNCTAYVESETSKTFGIIAPMKFGVADIDSFHVSTTVNYILA